MDRLDYPLSLDLRGRRVVVVGGGPVAARRVAGLVEAGAAVEVVSPWLVEDLDVLVRSGRVSWHDREYLPGDLVVPQPAWLAHTATADAHVDAAVAREAEDARIWCVRADDASQSAAWTPAVARGGAGTPAEGLTVAVTGGGDPRRARAVRDAVHAALETGTFPVRRVRPPGGVPPGRGVGEVAAGQNPVEPGRVSLVGGGPGADDLITVRGRTVLAQADVVVTDRLAPRGLLTTLADEVEVIDVGKVPGRHPVGQDEINELLVHHASQGKRVVRLKGGDPFVLGRGGEEALYCAEHGIPVDVVPGVTSAVSVPAAAGIPVTHRGITASFVVASAHAGASAAVRASAEAPPDATLVLLMGVTGLGETAAALIASGRDPATPVALVERGWAPDQRTTVTTLATAHQDALARGVTAPAVVVVGDVVGVREQVGDLAWDLTGKPSGDPRGDLAGVPTG